MAHQAPLAAVNAKFGSKEKLAAQLAASLDVPEGQTREQFQKFLRTLSNHKLLKLHRVQEEFTARYGGKPEKAIGAIVEKRGLTGKAEEAFREEAQGYSRARLLDLVGTQKTGPAIER
jgi:hypothetical protein